MHGKASTAHRTAWMKGWGLYRRTCVPIWRILAPYLAFELHGGTNERKKEKRKDGCGVIDERVNECRYGAHFSSVVHVVKCDERQHVYAIM